MKSPIIFVLAAAGVFAQTPAPAPTLSADFFENKVRPILANNCYDCHGPAEMGGLRLDSRERLLQGGKSGAGDYARRSG